MNKFILIVFIGDSCLLLEVKVEIYIIIEVIVFTEIVFIV